MKKNQITTLLLAAVVVLFSNCRKIEKIETAGNIKPKLIVNSIAGDDDIFVFLVSKSLSALDNAPLKTLKNATIVLSNSKGEKETITYNPIYATYFSDNIKVVAGESYTIEATAPGMEKVSASMTMPNAVKLNSGTAVLKGVTRVDFGSGNSYKSFQSGIIRASFTDNGAEENSYMLVLKEKWHNSGVTRYGYQTWECKFPGIEEISSNYSGDKKFFFKDGVFNGKTIELEFNTTTEYNYLGDGIDSIEGWNVELYHVTEDLSKHWFTLYKYQENEGNPFEEPVQIFNNIKGGYGVFGGRSKSEFFVAVP